MIGREVHYFSAIASTNSEARRLAAEGASDGTVLVADHQTAGRGRLDRRWFDPPQSSLLISLILRPQLSAERIHILTMIAGLAVIDAVEEQTGLCPSLKWPNDILLGGSKLGGILTEIELAGSRIDAAVVGIGLNVNLDSRQLPGNLLLPATSLSQATGRRIPRLPLLLSLLLAFERRYLALGRGADPREEWTQRLDTLGRHVKVQSGRQEITGVAVGVGGDGSLQVRLADGRLVPVLAGDVLHQVSGKA